VARKRDALPEVVTWDPPLRAAEKVVDLLDGQMDIESHRRAIFYLLTNGPCFAKTEAHEEFNRLTAVDIARIAQALRIYLRNAVRHELQRIPIELSGVRVSTIRSGHSAISFMDGPLVGVAGLALMLLLHIAGFQQLWACGAPDCPRVFVKTYRREFCSERCQKRTYKRRKRQDAREQMRRARPTPRAQARTGRT